MSAAPAEAKTRTLPARLLRGFTYATNSAVIMGAVIIYTMALPNELQNPLLGFLLMIAGFSAVTLVHELGHAAAAALIGWRVIIFAVRPFALNIPSRSLVMPGKAIFHRKTGYVVAIPAQREALTIRRFKIFIAGGPLICLAFATFLAATAAWLCLTAPDGDGPLSPGVNFANEGSIGLCLQALRSGLMSWLPPVSDDGTTDGSMWRRCRLDPYQINRRSPWSWLKALQHWNIRPRDFPQWMLDDIRPGSPAAPASPQFSDGLAISAALDAKTPDPAQARRLLEAYRQAYATTEWFNTTDAYVAAMYEANPGRAEAALAGHQPPYQIPHYMAAARAAIAARHGDKRATKIYLLTMRKALRQNSIFRDRCFSDIERQIRRLLRRTLAQPHAPTGRLTAGQPRLPPAEA